MTSDKKVTDTFSNGSAWTYDPATHTIQPEPGIEDTLSRWQRVLNWIRKIVKV